MYFLLRHSEAKAENLARRRLCPSLRKQGRDNQTDAGDVFHTFPFNQLKTTNRHLCQLFPSRRSIRQRTAVVYESDNQDGGGEEIVFLAA